MKVQIREAVRAEGRRAAQSEVARVTFINSRVKGQFCIVGMQHLWDRGLKRGHT